jgi:hypothetical protein
VTCASQAIPRPFATVGRSTANIADRDTARDPDRDTDRDTDPDTENRRARRTCEPRPIRANPDMAFRVQFWIDPI